MPKPKNPSNAGYFRHEVLDRLEQQANQVGQALSHPSLDYLADDGAFTIKQQDYINKRVEKAIDELIKAYQYVGKIHL